MASCISPRSTFASQVLNFSVFYTEILSTTLDFEMFKKKATTNGRQSCVRLDTVQVLSSLLHLFSLCPFVVVFVENVTAHVHSL